MILRLFFRYILWLSLSIVVLELNAQDASNDGGDHETHVDHQDADHNHDDHAGHAVDKDDHGDHSSSHSICGHTSDHEFNPGQTAFHHISDQNIYNIGWLHFPLPCMLYIPGEGLEFFSSGKFNADYHGTGTKAYNRFVLFGGQVRRITDASFPMGLVDIGEHSIFEAKENVDGKEVENIYLCYNENRILCESKSTLDFGLFGGGLTSFHDLSITKNVLTMLIIFGLMAWMFISIARAYKNRQGMAPSGIQGFMEPMFEFIQEEVCKPFLGHRWQEFQPFIMSLFFFILGLNLFGQIPFFGGSNVTGNLSVTFVLALLAFIVTNINGNKHYWGHVFNMPGVPFAIKAFVVTPVEIMGLFIKPITLMLRLFGNITAGHMVIVIFVSLIFIFGESGAKPLAAWGTSIGSVLLTLFMMAIELLVAFIQAFVFAILTASYIGAAIEEHHDH